MKNKNYKKFFMCSLFVLNIVGMHSDCEINIGKQILEAVHRSEKFPFVKYDDEFYSNVPSKTFDKKDCKFIYSSDSIRQEVFSLFYSSKKVGQVQFSCMLLKVNGIVGDKPNYNIYQLFYNISLLPFQNYTFEFDHFLKRDYLPYTKFAWAGVTIEHNKPDSTSELWHDIYLLEVSPKTECNKMITFTETNGHSLGVGVETGTQGVSGNLNYTYSYTSATSYSTNLVEVGDYSFISYVDKTLNQVSTLFTYNINGIADKSWHMSGTSEQNGSVIFSVRSGGSYTIDFMGNAGFQFITGKNKVSGPEITYRNTYGNNANDYSTLITFIG